MQITKEILESDVQSGMTLTQLGEKYGCRASAIHYWMKKFGIRNITYDGFKERREQYIGFLKDGLSTEEIAEKMGCSFDTASNYIKAHKLHGFRKKKRVVEDYEKKVSDKGVLCRAVAISKTKRRCLYGGKCGNCDCCDYFLMTGKLREYDPENTEICYCFVYADDETKRRVNEMKRKRERDILIG